MKADKDQSTTSTSRVLNPPANLPFPRNAAIRANTVKISRGDRIAQLVVQRVERAVFQVVDELDDTARGAGGHGSTGGHHALPTQASTQS